MAQNVKNAVYGKPKVGGAVWSAPDTTELPTDASTELGSGFEGWGYISDAGIAENGSISSSTTKAYGGSTVITIEAGNDITYTFTPLEYMNPVVQKELYGTSNVTEATGVLSSVKLTDDAHERRIFVFEHILSNCMVDRPVLPRSQLTAIATNPNASPAALGPEVTVTPYPDASGVKVYKYFAKAA